MSEKLKPCPFCGYEINDPVQLASRANYEWNVSCTTCEIVMQRPTEEKVVEAWNRRLNPNTDIGE